MLFAVLLSLMILSAFGSNKVISTPVCAKPPVINGKLDDKCWKTAALSGAFQTFKSGQQNDSSEFKICRDNSWLYFGIACRNPHMKDVEAKHLEYDDSIHEDDSVEIFLDPGTDGKLYYHFLLSFRNIRADRMITISKGQDLGWNLPWRSAVQVDRKGWTAEIALPLSALMNYGELADTKLNVCRNQVNPVYDTMGLKVFQKREFSSWSPVKHGFHEPENFGQLQGLTEVNPEPPFLPAIEQAEVEKYQLNKSGNSYEVAGTVRTYNQTSGSVELAVVDKPVSGKQTVIKKNLVLPGNKVTEFAVKVPVSGLFQRQVELALRNPQSGEVLQQYPIRDTTALALMQLPVVGRNYYTSEKEATILCYFGCKQKFLWDTQTVIMDTKGKILVKSDKIEPNTRISVPISNLAAGTHVFNVVLLQKNGMKLAEKQVSIIKKAPHPGHEVKIDQINRVVLVNNKPFFPFGIFFSNTNGKVLETDMKYVAAAGFNFVKYWSNWGWGKDSVEKFIAACDQHGLYNSVFIKELVTPPLWTNRYKVKENMPNIIAGIKQFKKYSRLIGYQTIDEPNLGHYETKMKEAKELYNLIMQLDGYHPVEILYAREIPELERARKYSQIVSYDLYLWAGTNLEIATPNYVTKYTVRLADICRKANLVPWIVLSSESLNLQRTPRPIFPAEQRSQTYLAVIHGAKGLIYFHLNNIFHEANWKTLSALAGEITSIAPVLTAPEVPQQISYSPVSFIPKNSQYPDVQVRLFKAPNGNYLLLAANSRNYPSDTIIRIKGLGKIGTVKSRFAKTNLLVKDDTFSECFAPFQTRVYELGKLKLPQTAKVAVMAKSHPEQVLLKGKVVDRLMRVNAKNFFPNGDFSQEVLPGWPKFFMPFGMGPFPGIGSKNSPWMLDHHKPKFGKKALRLALEARRCRGFFAIAYPPPLQKPAPYVLSLYMKADHPCKLTLNAPFFAGKQFILGRKWKRYVLKGILQPNSTGNRGREFLFINPKGKKVTVWFDGLQFEAGETPTKFTTK